MAFRHSIGGTTFAFADLKELMAKATPLRSGDGSPASRPRRAEEHVAAQMALADVPLQRFLDEPLVPYEDDEVTRLILDSHDARGVRRRSAHLTVGEFRDWLLSDAASTEALAAPGARLTPEMAAAVSKLMRNQDLILAARKCRVVTRFRNTIGLPGRWRCGCSRTTRPTTRAASPRPSLDGLLLRLRRRGDRHQPGHRQRCRSSATCCSMLDDVIQRYEIPTQSCVLAHVTTTLRLIERGRAGRPGVPVDRRHRGGQPLVRRDLALLDEAATRRASLKRGTVGDNVMYFETGQGSALSADAHHGVDQQTCEARAYARGARASSRCWSTPSSASSARSTSTTASRSSAPGWRTTSAASCSACRWAATSATPTTPRPTRTTWTRC